MQRRSIKQVNLSRFIKLPVKPSTNGLHLAAEQGNLEDMEQLVEQYNFDVNALHTEEKIPPIASAIRAGQLHAAKWLAAHGANIDYDRELYPFCFSVWHYVIFFSKNLDIIIWLEKATHTHLSAHINRCPTEGPYRGTTIFWTAAYNHDWVAVTDMLLWEAEEDANCYPETSPGESSLWLMVKAAHFEFFKKMLTRINRANPNAASLISDISIPLMLAFYRQIDLLWQLEHEYGIAMINATSSTAEMLPGATIAWHLASQDQFSLVFKLIKKYHDLNIKAAPLVGPDKSMSVFEVLLTKRQYTIAEFAYTKDPLVISVLRKDHIASLLAMAIFDQQFWLTEAILNYYSQFKITDIFHGQNYAHLLKYFIGMVFNHLSENLWKTLMQACLTYEIVKENKLNERSQLLLNLALDCGNANIQQATVWIVFLALLASNGRFDLATADQFDKDTTILFITFTEEKRRLLSNHKNSFIKMAEKFMTLSETDQRENSRAYLTEINPLLSIIPSSLIQNYYAFSLALNGEEEERILGGTTTWKDNHSSTLFHSSSSKQRKQNFTNSSSKRQAI
jgi:hypothetical protein